jgi:pre-mRNA cleavage complex 2 protein Pcf11
MEEERYANTNPNPNPSSQNKLPVPSVLLDRFKSMVRERDDEMRILNPDQSPLPLDVTEVVTFYDQLLRELTFNSKPVITELTILADDYRPFAEGIADAICTRISEVETNLSCLFYIRKILLSYKCSFCTEKKMCRNGDFSWLSCVFSFFLFLF